MPVYNEQENIGPLVASLREALASQPTWELVLVDDGSSDATGSVCSNLAAQDNRIRVLRLARNYGQTAAMQAGFDHALGLVVVTMDGDLQNDPRDIPKLLDALTEGYDLVAGYRQHRKDKLITRRIPSWIANRIIRWLTGVNIRDNGCSLKAYRREVLQRMRLYSDMHRFIPAVAAAVAGARVVEVGVRHHARLHGKSKYGLSRVLKVLADLMTVRMIRSFRERPLLLFGQAAILAFIVGLAFGISGIVAYVYFRPEKANAFVLPGAAVMLFALSFYLLLLGLVAEKVLQEHKEEASEPLPLARQWLE